MSATVIQSLPVSTRGARPWVGPALRVVFVGAGVALSVGMMPGPSARAQTAGDAPSAAAPTPVLPTVGSPVSAPLPAASASTPSPPRPTEAPAAGGASAAAVTPAQPHDLSPWAMYTNADIVVKGVMVGLAFASLVTWTIWLAKGFQLVGARFRAVRAVRVLMKATSLDDLEAARGNGPLQGGPVSALVFAAVHERTRSGDLPADGIKERAAIALQRVEARAARTMTRGTGLVATIGSTAPFVGLFGTVWGIMNAFVGISEAHTTNLAVVAPGIAEALLATAIGLVAAIPAVVIYNQFARAIAGYKALLGDASAEVMRHLSRDLDRRVQAAE